MGARATRLGSISSFSSTYECIDCLSPRVSNRSLYERPVIQRCDKLSRIPVS